jgi:hypothetical protein
MYHSDTGDLRASQSLGYGGALYPSPRVGGLHLAADYEVMLTSRDFYAAFHAYRPCSCPAIRHDNMATWYSEAQFHQ